MKIQKSDPGSIKEYVNSLTSLEAKQWQLTLERARAWVARKYLTKYAQYIYVPGAPIAAEDEECEEFYADTITPAQHHELLLGKLQDVAEGRIKRLMILMPPGTAKSTYASVVFPTWVMGRWPAKNIIMTTYGSDLAKKFGRKCRQIVRSKEFEEIFGHKLTGDNAAVDDWSITNGSTYMCGGILSGITGNRADGLIVDDPFKGREEADSETIRQKVLEEYRSSLKTRLKPTAWEIIINTRWHEDDLSGNILPEGYKGESGWITARDGEEWYVLCLQAQCELENDPLGRSVGEYLWTDWFPVSWWEQTKRTQSTPSPRNWNALYQQRPSADEGDYFKREWLRWYAETPKHLRIYGASDYAVTDGGGDYTVHLVVGLDPDDNIYILDVWREQKDPMIWVDELIKLAKSHKPSEWLEENGQIIKSVGSLIDKCQREESAYFYRRQFTSAVDKATRAQAIRGRMAQGKVYFPKSKPWVDTLVNELMTFPVGKHDDQVDALSLIGRALAEMRRGEKPQEKKPFKINTAMPTLKQIADEIDRNAGRARESANLS